MRGGIETYVTEGRNVSSRLNLEKKEGIYGFWNCSEIKFWIAWFPRNSKMMYQIFSLISLVVFSYLDIYSVLYLLFIKVWTNKSAVFKIHLGQNYSFL